MSSALLFAEDPGAANALARVAKILRDRINVDFFTMGPAARRADELGIDHQPWHDAMNASDVLASLTPDVLVVGTSDRIETPSHGLVHAARHAGCPSIGIVDGQAAFGHRFRGSGDAPFAFAPDIVAVPDDVTAANFCRTGLPVTRVTVVGNPHYDAVIEKRSILKQSSRRELRDMFRISGGSRPVIMFATETSVSRGHADHSPKEGDGFTGFSGTRLRTHIALEEFFAAIALWHPRPYLILRLHPKNSADEFSWALSQFDLISDSGDPLPLVACSDLVVGLTSILLEESVLVGTPALAMIRRDDERNWLLGVREGWVRSVTSRADLPEAIAVGLAEDRDAVSQGAMGALDLGADERVCALIQSSIGQSAAR